MKTRAEAVKAITDLGIREQTASNLLNEFEQLDKPALLTVIEYLRGFAERLKP